MKYKFILSGTGGQGAITAGLLLGEATATYGNLFAVQTQSYGPEARGGAARTDVIISSSKIHYPKVMYPDVLVCLSQEAYNKYIKMATPGGLVIYDSHNVKNVKIKDYKMLGLDMFGACMSEFNSVQMINICMLGVLSEIVELIDPETIRMVIRNRFKPSLIDINLRALDMGINLVRELGEEKVSKLKLQ